MSDKGLIQGQITDEAIALMRERIGYPNPTLRGGLLTAKPWNSVVSADALRHWAVGIGDGNPLYNEPEYAAASRWKGLVAPPGFEMSMGWKRDPKMDPDRAAVTSKALRGVQLFNSGNEAWYWAPVREGDTLYKSEWVADVQLKQSEFAGRSAVVTNHLAYWNQREETVVTGTHWFVHAERRPASTRTKSAKDEPAHYTDEQLQEIEQAYDEEFVRGPETLYLEDVQVGQSLPRMVRGPFTITDMINLHLAAGWLTYGNPPHRLAYENRKMLRGFYSKNEFNAWDTVQRVHWDASLAETVGVKMMYDIGPCRHVMICNYATNFGGDNAFVHYIRSEYRNFNYMGDTTWIQGVVTEARVDESLGPLISMDISGVNQRGKENIRAKVTLLVDSREHGPMRLPATPPMTEHRS